LEGNRSNEEEKLGGAVSGMGKRRELENQENRKREESRTIKATIMRKRKRSVHKYHSEKRHEVLKRMMKLRKRSLQVFLLRRWLGKTQ